MRLPPLNALRAFEAASRHLSFQNAAEELNVTPSALSYQIKSLEEHLGVQLFNREVRRVSLTREGQIIRPGIADAFLRLQNTVDLLEPDTPDDVIVVTCGPSHAAKWLAPRLSKFAEKHPDLELRISASLKLVDFRKDGVDVALRFGTGHYEGLYIEKLFDEFLIPMASPTTLANHPELNHPDDLRHFLLLHDDSFTFLGREVGWKEWLTQAGATQVDGTKGLRFTHADHCIEAATKGAGIALGRLELAAEDIKEGRLVTPFERKIHTGFSSFFVCPPEAMKKEKNQRFRDWIFEELNEAIKIEPKET